MPLRPHEKLLLELEELLRAASNAVQGVAERRESCLCAPFLMQNCRIPVLVYILLQMNDNFTTDNYVNSNWILNCQKSQPCFDIGCLSLLWLFFKPCERFLIDAGTIRDLNLNKPVFKG